MADERWRGDEGTEAIAELVARVGIARLHGCDEVLVPTLGAYALNHRLYEALGWTHNADGSLNPPAENQEG